MNFDVSPALRLQRVPVLGRFFVGKFGRFPGNVLYGDIIQGLPVLASTADAVYCSHVLEHLSLQDLRVALKNVLGLLKPGGVFRFVLPDLEFLASEYLKNATSDACSWFMRESYLGKEIRARGLSGLRRDYFGNSLHLWMWDFKGLAAELESCGFRDVRRACFADSPDPMFYWVEDESRWRNALGMECRK